MSKTEYSLIGKPVPQIGAPAAFNCNENPVFDRKTRV
jgi:hypothetical protein